MNFRVAMVAGSLLLAGACGRKSPDAASTTAQSAESGVAAYSILSGKDSTLKESSEGLSGSGVALFSDSLSPPDQVRRFQVSFRLEEGGSLRFYLFSSKALAKGLELFLIRSSGSLAGNLSYAGRDADVSNRLTTVDAKGDMTLTLEVDNSRKPAARVLIWNGEAGDAATALVDTNKSGHPVSPGRGEDVSWGVQLYKASLLKARTTTVTK
jgi:hypothetical protein